jgi:Mg-chelatase subunit ChlD
MRKMGRATAWICLAALIASSCSSSKPKSSSSASKGGGPFGNAPTSSGGGAGATGKNSGATGTVNANGGCAMGTAHASRVTPRVVLVVDGSCSMSSNYPSMGRDATSCMPNANGRWAAVRRALIDPQNGVVTRLQGAVEFGLAVFGTQPMCPIPATPIDPALNNLQAITSGLPDVQPGMFTPTGPALSWVYDNLFNVASAPDQHNGPQIVILATDGEPNSCNNATTNFQPSIDAVTKGQMKGIKTYVISLATGSGQFHDHLQQVANIGASASAGSNAPLYEPGTPDELAADLQLLIGGAVGCDVALNGSVMMGRECEGTVTLNGAKLPCDKPDGWILPDPRHIRLQGKACDMLKASKDALLDASFPCGVFMVQ